ncbi:hypothetical protein [Streptomyces sp. NPDC093093]|uniref:hypothetical protein n=1 Tax=Streptomyces sp. NPDC093093 TaxID=3366025 RepID=UPI00382FF755
MAGPKGVLRGRTAEANALAVWLRDVTRGKSLRELEEELATAGFPYAKSSWSEVLKGSRPPSRELIEAVVGRYVTTDRAGRLEECLALLDAAKLAQQALGEGALPPAGAEGARLGPVAQAYKDLAEAQQKNAEAWQKLRESEGQRRALEKTVSMLRVECTRLEVELEQTKEGRGELERELEQLREFRDWAGGQLDHARRLEVKAFTVQTAAVEKVVRDEAVLRALGRLVPEAEVAVVTAGRELPTLDELARFREAVEERLEAQDAELDELGKEVGLPPSAAPVTAADGPPAVPGQPADEHDWPPAAAVPGHRRDSQDNAVNSEYGDAEHRDRRRLLALLETVQTLGDMAASFKQSQEHEGSSFRPTIAELTTRAFGDTPDTAQQWAAERPLTMASGMPRGREYLASLITELNAAPEEVEAFERAYDRVEEAYSLPLSPTPAAPRSPLPAPVVPQMPAEPAAADSGGRALAIVITIVITIVISVVLFVIGQFQRAPSPGKDLTAAGWWLTGIGGFLFLASLIVMVAARMRNDPVVGETHDHIYSYPPTG